MPGENDTPLTEEELALAREGEKLISTAVADTRAPQSLREAIERDRERAAARDRAPFWQRHRRILAAGAGMAAALVAVAIALETGSDGTEPSLDEVYAAAERNPSKPAPAAAGGTPPVLEAKVGALEFPDWRESFDWKAVGRTDSELDGRRVITVFYRNPEGAQLGYAVVGGDPLDGRPAGRPVEHKGDRYDVERGQERTIVTWTQQGHTCAIVAPSTVSRSTLLDLAASRNA